MSNETDPKKMEPRKIESGKADKAYCDHEMAGLLPWHVAGKLSAADQTRMQAHLASCALCQDDVKRERELLAMLNDDDTGSAKHSWQPGLQRLRERIDVLEQEPAAAEPALHAASGSGTKFRWLGAVVAVQALGLVLLSAAMWQNRDTAALAPNYTTLTSGPAQTQTGPGIRAIFAPAMTLEELSTLLNTIDATIVAGPSQAGIYTLSVQGTSAEAAVRAGLQTLRSDKRVLFAEPAGTAAAQQ